MVHTANVADEPLLVLGRNQQHFVAVGEPYREPVERCSCRCQETMRRADAFYIPYVEVLFHKETAFHRQRVSRDYIRDSKHDIRHCHQHQHNNDHRYP